MFVGNNLSLQLRIVRLADVFRDFAVSDERAHAAFRRYRALSAILQARLNARNSRLVIGERQNESEEAGTDVTVIHRKSWTREINGVSYSFWRRTYADGDVQLLVWSDERVLVHDLWGRTTEANKPGLLSFSETLGKLIQF